MPFRRSEPVGNRLAPLMGVAGCVLLVYLIAKVGLAAIATHLQGLVPILPAVLLITGLKYPLQAAGWRLVLPRHARPPWGESISATITGDAVGYLTWAGPVTGEPVRAFLIRGSVPVAEGVAAGAAERAMYNVTAAVLVGGVLLVLLARAHWPSLLAVLAAGALGAAALAAVARSRARRRPPDDNQPAVLDRPSTTESRPGRGGAAFLAALRAIWRDRRRALPAIALLCVAQHALLVGEAYLMLGVLGGVTLHEALVFEAVTKMVNTAGFVVPGRLGVAEGGSALLANALGFAASHGLSLALMRRVRALLWGGVGLALLPFQEARARRRQRPEPLVGGELKR